VHQLLPIGDNVMAAVSEAGGVPLLLDTVKEGDEGAAEHCAAALAHMAVHGGGNQIVAAGGIKALVAGVKRGGPTAQFAAAACWDVSASCEPSALASIAAAGGPAALVQLLKAGDVKGQTNAAGALRNLAKHPENQRAIMDHGGGAALVALLGSSEARAQNQAGGALRNLTVGNPENARAIAAGPPSALGPLVGVLRSGGVKAKEQAAAALCNLTLSNPQAQAALIDVGGLPPLAALLQGEDGKPPASDGTEEHAAGTLANVASTVNEYRHRIFECPGALGGLITLMSTGEESTRAIACSAIGNLAIEQPEIQQAIGSAGGVAALVKQATSGRAKEKALAVAALQTLSGCEPCKAEMAKLKFKVPRR